MPQIEELQQAKLAAGERARRIVEDLKLRLEVGQNLTPRDRYLTWVELAKEFGWLARTEGRLV